VRLEIHDIHGTLLLNGPTTGSLFAGTSVEVAGRAPVAT
jgi:hypothetical protein